VSTDAKAPPTKAVAKFNYDRPAPNGVAGLQEMGKSLLPQISAAMPGFMAKNSERMLRCLLTECQKTPALLDCTPKSLFGAVIQVAQLGLELGGPAGHAYLIPFGKKSAGVTEATLIIGYKGFLQLAFRAGVKSFRPQVVRAGDVFQIEYGTRADIRHVPNFERPGEVVGYYSVVESPTGGKDFEYMTKAQAEEHRLRYAMAKNGGPWTTNFDEMALKTTVRKLAKRVPLSPEWVTAASLDELAEQEIPQQLSAALVLEAPEGSGEAPSLRDRLDRAKRPAAVEANPGAGPDANIELDENGDPIFLDPTKAAGLPD
jgi:recombination protein RecT